ncbi:acyltransferase [Lipingzhangella sp. LS1_29]|uniref:Acyltransferase n=1 Tax=Lipingzhangella rawalii TaxID=2055835 RepID=A0ABU2HA76_9ACTN|nr:acyltransferase [Lipingzhangella rawalii]MDS1272197.1 acyltransferase [Lipingzhangella rawalii]
MVEESAVTRPGDAAEPRDLPQVTGHHAGLDGVRAVAALMVLVFHVAVEVGVVLEPGLRGALLSGFELAVPLFFALSGVLLYRPWVRATLDDTERPRAAAYLWRRAVRVLPAYWVVAVVALLLYSREYLDSVGPWLQVLTLTFIYDPDPSWWFGTGPQGLGQIWSLCTEVAFYLVLPVLALMLHRWARRGRPDVHARARRLLIGLGVLMALSVVALLVQFYPVERPYMHAWLPRTMGLFAVGMALAVLSEWAWRDARPHAPVRRLCRTVAQSPALCWGVAAAAFLVSAGPVTGPRFMGTDGFWSAIIQYATALAFAAFFVAPIAFQPKSDPVRDAAAPWAAGGAWLRTVMAGPTMTFLAKISYGVFLWQFLVLYLWRDFTGQEPFTGSFWLDLGPVFAGTVLAAMASYHLVERPTSRWLYPLVSGKRPVQSEPSSHSAHSSNSASASSSSSSNSASS